MSLLDDVSIVVTPNGYKAGELYAVIPVPTEGAEEVTDGNFPTPNTEWSSFGLATINENIVNFVDAGSNTYSGITQDINSFSAKRYKVEITVTNWISGDILATFSSNTESFNITGNGTYSVYLSPVNNGDDIGLVRNYSSGANFSYSITSVSVKEYTSADMDVTRETAATRVDENGLVNYAEVIGGEEVTNGDFATDLSGWTLDNTDVNNTIVWNNGRVDMTGNGDIALLLTQTVFEVGKYYKIELDAYNITGAGFKIYDGAEVLAMQSDGHYTVYHTAASTDFNLYRYQTGAASSGEFDNISVKEVTRDNVPRIDYTGGGCPHILAEPQRTNLFEYSESFNNIQWSRSSVTVVDNSSQSPDGTNNASLLYPSSSGDFRYMHNSTTASSSIYTMSAFVKASGKNVVWFYINSSSQNGFIYYNLSDQTTQVVAGSVGTPTGTIISYGNDWYKISFTTGTAFTLGSGSGIGVSDVKGNSAVTANGTDGVLVWGLQLEAGSYATSYIPTSGSTVTRNQDIFTRDGIGSLINSTEGVLFWEGSGFINGGSQVMLSLSDGTSSNVIQSILHSTASRIIFRIILGGVNTVNISSFDISQTENLKIALKYKENDFALWINGVEKASLTSGSTFSTNTINELNFSDGNGASSPFFGKVKQLQVYDTALTDEQLLQLTGESGTDFYESYAEMASALTYTIQ